MHASSIVTIFFLLLVVGVVLQVMSGSPVDLPVRARRLMTDRERRVCAMIEAALPNCRVHAQVSMGAVVDCNPGLMRKRRVAVRNRFDRKIIDFVLEERSTGDILGIIEPDDRTHKAAKDKARDRITAAAGHRTIRLGAGERITDELLAERLVSFTGFKEGTTARAMSAS